MFSALKAAAIAAFMIVGVWSQSSAAERDLVVEVGSVVDIVKYLKDIGFVDIPKHPERLQAVPRLRMVRVPTRLKNVWRENVTLRKSVFSALGYRKFSKPMKWSCPAGSV